MRFPNMQRAGHCLALGAIAAISVACMTSVAGPAAADSGLTQTNAAIRGGLLFPLSSETRHAVGSNMYDGGLDYTFSQKPFQERYNLSVDYIQKSSSGSNITLVPVTVSAQYYSESSAGVRPYVEFGGGLYFEQIKEPNNPNITGTKSGTAPGFFAGAGLDFPGNVFLDAKWQVPGEINHVRTSGIQVNLGFRF